VNPFSKKNKKRRKEQNISILRMKYMEKEVNIHAVA